MRSGCEQCIFSEDPHRVGELGWWRGGGEERKRGSCRWIPFRKCQSALSRTHSWLSINIVVDSTLARSFIELSFRLNGQIAWVVAFCLSISVSIPSSSPSIVRYPFFTSIDDVTFGAYFLLYIIELRGKIAKEGSSPSSKSHDDLNPHELGGIDEDPSIFQEGDKLCELLQLLLRQTDLVRLTVLFLVDLFARLHYGTVDAPASVNGGLSGFVGRHSAHRRHSRQVQRGVRFRYQPHHLFSNVVCKNRGSESEAPLAKKSSSLTRRARSLS